MKRHLSRISTSLIALALVGIASVAGVGQQRPFHLVEHGRVQVNPLDTTGDTRELIADGIGTATHLGLFTLHREAVLQAQTPGGVVFNAQGTATLTAANGDQLFTTFTGTVDFSTGHADLIYQWAGGTNKFEDATGTTTWSVDVAKGEYDSVADGEIIFN